MKGFIIFSLVFLLIVTSIIFGFQAKQKINFGEIDISSKNLNSIVEPLPEGRFNLCSLKERNKDSPCIPMFKGALE